MSRNRKLTVEERAQEIRDEAAACRARRLGRGNLRIQNCFGVNVSTAEAEKRRKEQPERVRQLNRLLGAQSS